MPVPPWENCSTTVGKLQYHRGSTGDAAVGVVSDGRLSALDNELGEQVFAFFLGDAPPLTVVAELVAVNTAYGEVLGFGMPDEETTHGGGGLDAVVVGQGDVELLLGLQPVEDDALERGVGTSGVAEGNTKLRVKSEE